MYKPPCLPGKKRQSPSWSSCSFHTPWESLRHGAGQTSLPSTHPLVGHGPAEPVPLQVAHSLCCLGSTPVPSQSKQLITPSPWHLPHSLSAWAFFHCAIADVRVRPLLTDLTSSHLRWSSSDLGPYLSVRPSLSASARRPATTLPSVL